MPEQVAQLGSHAGHDVPCRKKALLQAEQVFMFVQALQAFGQQVVGPNYVDPTGQVTRQALLKSTPVEQERQKVADPAQVAHGAVQAWQTLLEANVPTGQLVSATQVVPVRKRDPEQVVHVVGVAEQPVHGAVQAGQEGASWALPALQVRQLALDPEQVSH